MAAAHHRGLWQQCGNSRPLQVVHRIGDPVVHAGQDVGVGVQCDAYGGMTEQGLHVPGVGPLREQVGGGCVAQVVEAHLRQPRLGEQRLERASTEVLAVEGRTGLGCEYEAVLPPQGARVVANIGNVDCACLRSGRLRNKVHH